MLCLGSSRILVIKEPTYIHIEVRLPQAREGKALFILFAILWLGAIKPTAHILSDAKNGVGNSATPYVWFGLLIAFSLMIGYAARTCGVSRENLQIGPMYYGVWTSKGSSGLTEQSDIPHPTVSGRTCDILSVQLCPTSIEVCANGRFYTLPGTIQIKEFERNTTFGETLSDSELQKLHDEIQIVMDSLKPFLSEQRFMTVELPPLEDFV